MKKTILKMILKLGLLSLLMISTVSAEIVNKSYRQIDPASVPDYLPEGQVIEFFWYGCPHCYRMESLLNEAQLNDKVVKVPAVLRGSWMHLARVFYALQAMGLDKKMHAVIFNEIHENKNDLKTEEKLLAFLKQHQVDSETFMKHFNSDAVEKQAQNAALLTREYADGGVPAFVVNHQYVTSPNLAGTLEETLETVKTLLEK